jgi:hypothetical protein
VGEISFFADAEGATAPETLRQKDHVLQQNLENGFRSGNLPMG